MISVHETHDDYAARDDMVEVGRVEYPAQHGRDAFTRIDYEDVDTTCLHKMRGWDVTEVRFDDTTGRRYTSTRTHHGFCLLTKGHRGRHSTVVFGCDACGKTLRGSPSSGNDEVQFCFLCTREWEDGWRTVSYGDPY